MNLKLTAAVLPLVLPSADASRGAVAASSSPKGPRAAAAPRRIKPYDFAAARPAAGGEKSDLGILGGPGRGKGRRRLAHLGRALFANRRRLQDDDGDKEESETREILTGAGLDEIKDQAAVDACLNDECEPELCACVAEGGNAYDCAVELDAVCGGDMLREDGSGEVFTIDQCVVSPTYYKNVYCPFAACLVSGESYETCDCQFYQSSCDTYGEDVNFKDEKDTIQHCEAHACCQTKEDDAGRATCLASLNGEDIVLADDKEPIVEEPVVEEPVVEEPVEEPVVEPVGGSVDDGEEVVEVEVEVEEPIMADDPIIAATIDSAGSLPSRGAAASLAAIAAVWSLWG